MSVKEEEIVVRPRRGAVRTEEGGEPDATSTPSEELVGLATQVQNAAQAELSARAAKFEAMTQSQPPREDGLGLAADMPVSEAGTPITDYGYAYWDCLMYGPYQFLPPSRMPVRPNKIIRANEWALLLAAVWINPGWHFGNLPATQILGTRSYNAGFEMFNFTSVSNGPDQRTTGTFSGPAPQWSWFPFWFRLPDPGNEPAIYEAVFTIDVTNSGLDLAAFATWHFDPDIELPWGPYAPRWRHDMPARFLVYRYR